MPRQNSTWPISILKSVKPQALQRLHRHGDHLGIRLGRVKTDQLHARLEDLPAAAGLDLCLAQHPSAVADAVRQRPAGQARGHDPGDLRGDVGRERQQAAALAVVEAVGLALQLISHADREDIFVLQLGGDHAPEAPQLEYAADPALDKTDLGGGIGQEVADPAGQGYVR